MIDFGKILHYDTSIHKNVLEKRSGMTYERYKKSKNKKIYFGPFMVIAFIITLTFSNFLTM